MFVVPSEKVIKVQQAIASVPLHGLIPVRLLASIVGQIIAMSLAIRPIARLCTRYVYDVINYQHGWHAKLSLTEGSREELLFWRDSIGSFNGQPIWFSAGATRVAFQMLVTLFMEDMW